MSKITKEIKEDLRKPFGDIYSSVEDIINDYPNHKIIAVGDRTVLSFLRANKKPYISVFDFKNLRKRIAKHDIEYLKKSFPDLKSLRNLPSTVSKRLIFVAPLFLKSGGAMRVYGEEDLVALVFLYFADESYIIVYGQRDRGLVVANPQINRKRVNDLMDKIIPGFFP